MQFKKATRKQVKLRLAATGPSGSGKTTGALNIAAGMAKMLNTKIAVIDTEQGSASLYCNLCDFDTLELGPPFSPERYIKAIHAAEDADYGVLIIDSGSHEWTGSGGCLEINQIIADTMFKGNTWAAFNQTTPRHRAWIDTILQSKCHVICTFRSKTETVQEGGKVRKLGMKEETRDGTEYEFTTVLGFNHENHYAVALKDRTGLFKEPHLVTPKTGEMLIDWLNQGAVMLSEHPDIEAIQNANTLDELKLAFTKAYHNRQLESRREEITAIKDSRKLLLMPPTIEPVQTPPPAVKTGPNTKFKAEVEKIVTRHESRLPDIQSVVYDEILPRVAGREVTSAADLSDVEAGKAMELILGFISREGNA